MVLLTVSACSLGGWLLIDTQFRDSLEREVSALYEENDLLRYALAQELAFNPFYTQEELARAAGGISITTGQGAVAFRLSDGTGTALGGSGTLPVAAKGLLSSLPEGRRGWELAALEDGRLWLHAASPLRLEEGVLYLENCREVSGVFTTREEQYHTFSLLMLGLAGAVGIASLAISALFLRPLGRLSAATRRMAAGELDVRVRIDSQDELGRLSADFNAMAERLERQVQELTDAKRRQEDFVGSFAHEIKTPLTSIIGYADLLRSRTLPPEQVRQSVEYIFSEGRRLEALSRKLMDLIVLDRQDFPLHTAAMDAFLRRVGGAYRPALEQAGIRLLIRAEAAKIPIEPDLMENVCLNLLDNARKAISGGGAIALEGVRERGGYCIRVTDSGKGIPQEELNRITEAFYMVDKSRARAQGGAGLGLALCRRIVELHGGTMEFRSVEGKGTQVRIHLKGEGAA